MKNIKVAHKNIKVAHVINSLETGGSEMLLAELAPILRKKGIDVRIVTILDEKGIPYDIVKNAKLDLIELKYRNKYDLRIINEIYIAVRDFDIVHSHNYPAQLFCALAVNSKRLVTTEHSTYNRRRKSVIFKIPDYFMYQRYSSIICISGGTRDFLTNWIKSIKPKTIVINNGINIDKFYNTKPVDDIKTGITGITGIPDDAKLFACVARFEKIKNHETLINIFRKVDENIHLILVGEGSIKNEMESLVQQYSLQDRIHFSGVRNDIAEILKACAGFILLSSWEGFGLAAVEAMACGIPVILSNVPGLNQFVNNNDVGFLVDPDNENDIIEKIHFIVNNAVIANKMGQNAKEAAKSYSLEKMADEYIKVYHQMYRSMV